MIEIHSVGGYNEVGKNCTALKIDDEVILLDLGIHLESYIRYTQDEDIINLNGSELMKVGAVPNINVIDKLNNKVKAIIPTHAHLDHIGAIPYLSNKFDCPVIGTPYTTAVLKSILKDEKISIRNEILTINPNSTYNISKNIKIEFVSMTHSTPQTVMVAIHTKYGVIIYANDFKFDFYPVLGKKPDFKRLEELGKKRVVLLIVDSTYANDDKKTPSEAVAKQMLRDVLIGTDSKGKAVFVTTFSSHLARLKSIIDLGKKLNRKILFLGRSLSKYVWAGEDIKIINFSKDVEIVRYREKMKKWLKKVEMNREKYLVVVTGHQGEPKAILSGLVDNKFPFRFQKEDHVIFSCKTIPAQINIENREVLERKLKDRRVRIFKDIHVSGHAAREDLRDLINLVKPKHIIPAHGDEKMTAGLANLAFEMGYKKDNVHIMRDGGKKIIEL